MVPEVVGMAARKVDVETECQRARHEDLVLIQLRHVDVQCLAGTGFGFVEGNAFDRAGGLHGAQGLAAVRGAERVWHFHCILFVNTILI